MVLDIEVVEKLSLVNKIISSAWFFQLAAIGTVFDVTDKMVSMGVNENLAVPCGALNKSYWRSTKTAAIHMAPNKDFSANLGLISLRDR